MSSHLVTMTASTEALANLDFSMKCSRRINEAGLLIVETGGLLFDRNFGAVVPFENCISLMQGCCGHLSCMSGVVFHAQEQYWLGPG